MITGIDHVQITIAPGDETAARAFYCGVLGLPEVEKPDSLKGRGGFWIMVGDRALHVGTEEGVERRRTKAHVAYRVDDLAAWRDRLAAADVKLIVAEPVGQVSNLPKQVGHVSSLPTQT